MDNSTRTIYYLLGRDTIHRSQKCAKASLTWPEDQRRIVVPEGEYMPDYVRQVLPLMHRCLKCWHYDIDKVQLAPGEITQVGAAHAAARGYQEDAEAVRESWRKE